MDSISQHYIALAFDIEQHAAGFVDAYFGPPELRERPGGPRPPGEIITAIATLRSDLAASSYPLQRRNYLDAQLRGMETMTRKLAGEPISYRDEVRGLFDIEPQATSEAVFDEAIADLDAALPGSGDVAARMAEWKRGYEVTPEVARQMIDYIATEARARTRVHFGLPQDEAVEFALVSDKPWSGYNWYLGGCRSRVDINTDLPIRANSLLDLVCHEAYPGHHTEHALKDQALYQGQGWGEHAIQLINTPECVISEGIATLAAEMIFGDEAATWASASFYQLGGIKGDPEREQAIAHAGRHLRALLGNATLMLYEQGTKPDEVVAYIRRYGLRSEREARQSLRFIGDPLWSAYTFTYYVGRELLERWLARGDRLARFKLLLHEQVTPSLVESWIIEEERNCPG